MRTVDPSPPAVAPSGRTPAAARIVIPSTVISPLKSEIDEMSAPACTVGAAPALTVSDVVAGPIRATEPSAGNAKPFAPDCVVAGPPISATDAPACPGTITFRA